MQNIVQKSRASQTIIICAELLSSSTESVVHCDVTYAAKTRRVSSWWSIKLAAASSAPTVRYERRRPSGTAKNRTRLMNRKTAPGSRVGGEIGGDCSVKNGKPTGTTVLVFTGEYDLALRDQVRAAFDSVSHARRVIVDLSGATYIDSMIVQELVRVHNARAADDLEREWVVVRNRALLRVFEILRLAAVFRVVERLEEAISRDEETISMRYVSEFQCDPVVN